MVYIAKNSEENITDIKTEVESNSGTTSIESGDFLNQITPKSALIVGLIGSVMTLCTIGFIILLYYVFK